MYLFYVYFKNYFSSTEKCHQGRKRAQHTWVWVERHEESAAIANLHILIAFFVRELFAVAGRGKQDTVTATATATAAALTMHTQKCN